jgi:hypothetical protein
MNLPAFPWMHAVSYSLGLYVTCIKFSLRRSSSHTANTNMCEHQWYHQVTRYTMWFCHIHNENLRKYIYHFLCLPVCSHINWEPPKRFLWELILGLCIKICWHVLTLAEVRQLLWKFNMKTYMPTWVHLKHNIYLWMKAIYKNETHLMHFCRSYSFSDN